MNQNFNLNRLVLAILLQVLAIYIISAQNVEEPPSRSITSQDFQTKRPVTARVAKNKTAKKIITPVTNKKRRKNIEVVTNANRRYKLVKRVFIPKIKVLASVSSPQKSGRKTRPFVRANKQTAAKTQTVAEKQIKDEELGVTFWRLRPLKKSEEDDAPTFRVNIGDGFENWTAERVRSTTRFKPGERVRFTIESLRTGYIYILSREVYHDGSNGEAELIFPKMNGIRREENSVTAGRLVEIPSSTARQPYFNITTKREDYAGEEVIVIISPTKVAGFTIGAKTQSVRKELLDKWFNDWAAVTDTYDAEDGEGVAYTRTEEEGVKTRSLTREEPLPQTIYRFKSIAGKPLMVSFQLQVK